MCQLNLLMHSLAILLFMLELHLDDIVKWDFMYQKPLCTNNPYGTITIIPTYIWPFLRASFAFLPYLPSYQIHLFRHHNLLCIPHAPCKNKFHITEC